MKPMLAAAAAVLALAAVPALAAPSVSWSRVDKAETTVRAHQLLVAQRVLARDGDYKGKIDDKAGPRTVAAIETFQKQNGLKTTGWLDQQTWNRIKAASLAGRAHPVSG